ARSARRASRSRSRAVASSRARRRKRVAEMPQSMTGFGRAETRGRGPRLLCEARSVNHRFLSTKIRLPAQLQRLESWVDARLQSRFQRGSIEIAIFWRGAGETLAARLEEKVADRYLAALRAY